MRILLAPDKFKDSLSAAEAALAMAQGIHRVSPAAVCDQCPIGDGGEGTMNAIVSGRGGRMHEETVAGPLGTPTRASFAILPDRRTAVIELAQASGLHLVPVDRRDPAATTTYGTGELIRLAMKAGCGDILLCIGGSATIDGGTGIMQALGCRFFDSSDREMPQPITGSRLRDIARIAPPEAASRPLPRIRVACDVTNPLCGDNGAAAVYGPQKGATPEQVRSLDAGLAHLASVCGGDPNQPGAGAAGGAGYGLAAMCRATLERGIDLVLETVDFDAHVRDADLVITGEGRLDEQSLMGKACIGVSRAAWKRGVPTVAIVGDVGQGADRCVDPENGLLRSYVCLTERFGRERAMKDAAPVVALAAAELCGAEGRDSSG